MKKSRSYAVIIGMLLFSLLFAAVLPVSVRADSGQTLRLICGDGSVQIENMYWSIYKVGERQGNEIILTGPFADYPVDVSNVTEENISSIAKTLESFVVGDAIPETAHGYTDANGVVEFSGLDAGIYLAIPTKVNENEKTYISAPLLAELTENGEAVLPKIYTTGTLAGTNGRMAVKKVWLSDENATVSRPVDVTVDLYKDTEYYDTVTLDASNNWEYQWENLDEDAEWIVVERKIPREYTVLIEANSKQFLIKNMFREPAVTTEPSPAQTTAPAQTGFKLPQTGQSWQPVFLLAGGGMICTLLGLYLKKRSHE